MSPMLRRCLDSQMLSHVLYRFIRIYAATFRLRLVNESAWRNHLAGGGRVLLCCWHQHFFSFIRHFQSFRRYRPSLMISRSNDGSLIAGVAARSGWTPVRGSSSHGGREALAQMIVNLKRFGLAAHILDGPQGPAGVVKRGAVVMAAAADAAIVPVYAEAGRRWIFASWDRFFLPKPFSRVTIRYGNPIRVDAGDIDGQCRKLETLMRPALL